MTAVIIIIVIVVALVLWGISAQNSLVKLDELSKNALKQIGVQQQSRYDALKALVQTARESIEAEGGQMQDILANRRPSAGNTPADINANESLLTDIATKFMAVVEAYPQLTTASNYAKLMDEVKSYEEKVRLSRMTYNDTVTKYNNQVRMFPGSIVASILHFPAKEYLEEDKSKAEYPDIFEKK